MTRLHHDYESYSDIDLTKRGLDVYSADSSTEVLMCSYAFDDGRVHMWDATEDPEPPAELVEAIEDPHVEKHAFNAQFERVMAKRVLRLKTGYKNWRCTAVLAYMQGFYGQLGEVGAQCQLADDHLKDPEGKRLMRMFSMPNKPTKNQPLIRRTALTDPEEWEKYKLYCERDTISDRALFKRLSKYPVPDLEWELYEIDQRINDRGIPIDRAFVQNAIVMAKRRKA